MSSMYRGIGTEAQSKLLRLIQAGVVVFLAGITPKAVDSLLAGKVPCPKWVLDALFGIGMMGVSFAMGISVAAHVILRKEESES